MEDGPRSNKIMQDKAHLTQSRKKKSANGRPSAPAPRPSPSERPAGLELDARALLQGAREVSVVLDGEYYRLRITSNNKLILTK